MNGPIIAIRPEPGCSATVEAGRRRGLTIEGWPLFDVASLAWTAPDPVAVDGLLLGSANAIRHGGVDLAAYRDKPVWAVGTATADAASAAGFAIAGKGVGGLQSVVDRLEGPLRLLRLAGADHVAITASPQIEILTRIVYESRALPLPSDLAKRLPGALVLLHSAAAARHFAAEVDRAGLKRESMRLAALGPRIAFAGGTRWHEVRSASDPSDDGLLDLVGEMCHDRTRHGR